MVSGLAISIGRFPSSDDATSVAVKGLNEACCIQLNAGTRLVDNCVFVFKYMKYEILREVLKRVL